jgi:starch synthase (maltosyl-transferring)
VQVPRHGRRRVVIENVRPEIDGGRYPAKGSVGEPVMVEADVLADGHDAIRAVLRWREARSDAWKEIPLRPAVNDRWEARFDPPRAGLYELHIQGWVDHFLTWSTELERRVEAGQDVALELEAGAAMVLEAAARAGEADAERLLRLAARLRPRGGERVAQSATLQRLMERYADRAQATCTERPVKVLVERERARFSAWYECFPRSASPDASRPGTLRDVEARLDYVAGMGFDVLYLPPVHPIGRSFRKGRNNTVSATPSDVGSPWAIGSAEGGHKSVAADLGTLADLRHLARACRDRGLELALDIAFQCSPDHPWVRSHPEWFKHRPDGSIQYAENPPKKYQDIYPLDFESEDWQGLWNELLSVFTFWCRQGVRIFRVDNPHTKAFPFWEWCLARVRDAYPDALFLSEAFTRPKLMYLLAKLGFSQSYTYFAWRQEPWELKQYVEELVEPPVCDFFRPNFWPNTPDILTEQLQTGGRGMSALRHVLASTLTANYGIYGPAFELVDTSAAVPGKEEYLDSEKYQVRFWDLDKPGSLRTLISRVNRIRTEQRALRHDKWLRFCRTDNESLIAYTKTAPDGSAPVLVVVNLDPRARQAGWVELPVDTDGEFDVVDLLNGPVYQWRGGGSWNYIDLDPAVTPAHIFRIGALLK